MCDYEECVAHPIAEGGWVQQKGTDTLPQTLAILSGCAALTRSRVTWLSAMIHRRTFPSTAKVCGILTVMAIYSFFQVMVASTRG
jgi:hypothetical protein